MRHGLPTVLLGLVLISAAPLPAQSQPPAPIAGSGAMPLPVGPRTQPLTLEEAERLFVERNLTVIAARHGVAAARAQRLVASSLPPPQITVGNTIAEFNETNRRSFQGARLLSPSNNIAAGISFLIERGGKRTLRTRLAEESISVAEAQVLDALRIQLFQLRQAFFAALQARANLEVALANRASLDRTEALLRRQLRDGAIPEGDLLRFQASRLPFESDVTTNAQAYAAGVAAVAALVAADPAAFQPGAGQLPALGINPSAPSAFAPAGGRAPAPPGPARAPTTVQTILSPVAFDLRGRFDQMPELRIGREELAQGVLSRADVVAAQRQVSAANVNRQLQEAARSRDVTVNGSWSRTRMQQDLPAASNPNEMVSANNQFALSLSIPIFTSRIVEGNVGIAAAQAAQAEAVARNTLLRARSEFAAAWAAYEQARALLSLYTGGALNRAEEAYRSTEQAYLAGGRSLLDVLDALRTLNATRIATNQAHYAYLLALAQLELATGVSGIVPRL